MSRAAALKWIGSACSTSAQIRSQACRAATMLVLGLPIAAARRGGRDGNDHGFRLRTWDELTEFGCVDGGPLRAFALVTPWSVIWWREGPIHKSQWAGPFLALSCFFIEPGARRNAADGIGFAGHDAVSCVA